MRHWILILALLFAPLAWAQEKVPGPATSGYHQLVYSYRDGEQERKMPFLLYLPQGYDATAKRQWPLVVCLSGIGERGTDPRLLFMWGIAHDLLETPELQAWAPFMVLMPQCPTDGTWKTPQVARAVDGLVNQVMAKWAVDQAKVYLTGLSLGGGGCWPVSRVSPRRYAAIVSISGGSNEPEATVAALAGSGTTCLIISGELDPRSAPGSATMAKALRSAGVDVVDIVVPKGEHVLWPAYYGDRRFYDWLLAHRRGSAPPAGHLAAAQLAELGAIMNQPDPLRQRLNDELQSVAKYWQVDNWGIHTRPGLQGSASGKRDVFAVSPKSIDIPCRLLTTIKLPAPKPLLHIEVGHPPQGEWRLLVQVNEAFVTEQIVGPQSSRDGWITLDVDLSEFAGKEVRLQLVAMATGAEDSQTWWRKLEITGY